VFGLTFRYCVYTKQNQSFVILTTVACLVPGLLLGLMYLRLPPQSKGSVSNPPSTQDNRGNPHFPCVHGRNAIHSNCNFLFSLHSLDKTAKHITLYCLSNLFCKKQKINLTLTNDRCPTQVSLLI